MFDEDRDGMISVKEMRRLVERVGGSMSEAQARAIMVKVDTDNNGLIDFAEFRGLWAVVTGDVEVLKENCRHDHLMFTTTRRRQRSGRTSGGLILITMGISLKVVLFCFQSGTDYLPQMRC